MSQFLAEIRDIYLNQILTEEKKEKDDEDYGEEYEDRYKKSGKKSKDYDGDGEVEDETDEYAGVKDKAIRKKKNEDEDLKTETFSDWRSETNLFEVAARIAEKEAAQVKKGKRNNKVKINPAIAENFMILDEQELNEEFIMETVDYATEYLYEMGLNEKGLEMVIESLGQDQFVEYIFNISEDLMLTEARRSGRIEPVTKTGKPIGSLKGAAKTSSIKSKQKEKAARTEAENRASEAKPSGLTAALKSQSKIVKKVTTPTEKQQLKAARRKMQAARTQNDGPSGMTAALKRQSEVAKKISTDRGNRAVQTAVSQQPKTKPSGIKNRIARGILNALDQGMARHRAATTKASQAAPHIKKAVEVASKEFGSGVLTGFGLKNLRTGADTPLSRRIAKTHKTRQTANENVQYILEKAVSEQQQKIFGLALAVKRGEVSRSKVSDRVLEIVDGMSEAEIRKFAATAHTGIPKRKP